MVFENTLMILKPDYMQRRKSVLLKLLAEGFQIQTERKLLFSPELAAEFYEGYADEEGFMLEVILLAKGPAEAFILTKENAVQDLLNVMICYFGSSTEMDRNVHVTKQESLVAREINFIFPNYIHEPTPFFDKTQFCKRPMLSPLLGEIYDILQNVDCTPENWKTKVAGYLQRSNRALPQVSNQCMIKPGASLQEKAQQTTVSYAAAAKDAQPSKPYKTSSSRPSVPSTTSPHSSMMISSSSCVTCGGFERSEPCIPEIDLNKRLRSKATEKVCEDEEIIWKEVIVYEEEMRAEEEAGEKEGKDFFEYMGEGEEDGGEAAEAEEGQQVAVGELPSEVEIHSGPAAYDSGLSVQQSIKAAASPPPPPPPAAAVSEEPSQAALAVGKEQLSAVQSAVVEAPPAEPTEVEAAPVAEEPVAEEIVAVESIAEEPAAAEQPAAEESVVEQPLAEEPAAEEPAAEEPAAEEANADEPAAAAEVEEAPQLAEEPIEAVEAVQ